MNQLRCATYLKKLPIDDEVAVKAGDFKNKYNIPVADALIAATAYLEESTIISDDPDFKKIQEIKTLTEKQFITHPLKKGETIIIVLELFAFASRGGISVYYSHLILLPVLLDSPLCGIRNEVRLYLRSSVGSLSHLSSSSHALNGAHGKDLYGASSIIEAISPRYI